MMRRPVDILVLSDLHLGTYGCQAKKLLGYLRSIDPQTVVLNGDIVDLWLFDETKWPSTHIQVLGIFMDYVRSHRPVYYLTGNHDDRFRSAVGFSYKNLHVRDELVLDVGDRRYWVQHGDRFDRSVSGAMRNMAVWGGRTYDRLVKANRDLNDWMDLFGWSRFNITKRIKDSTKKRVSKSDDLVQAGLDHACSIGCHGFICGHIHQPEDSMRPAGPDARPIHYLNSGDWVESCTSLEFRDGHWHLYRHPLETPILLTDFLVDRDLSDGIDVSFQSGRRD